MLRSALILIVLFLAVGPTRSAESDQRPEVGQLPPPMLGRDRNGEDVNLEKLRGKVVVITFLASWCGPCRRELPMLGHFQKVVGREHLEVVAINYKEPKRDYLSVIRANQDIDLTYVHDVHGSIGGRYGVKGLPNLFIIDAQGRVAFRHRGYSEETLASFTDEILSLLPAEVLDRPTTK